MAAVKSALLFDHVFLQLIGGNILRHVGLLHKLDYILLLFSQPTANDFPDGCNKIYIGISDYFCTLHSLVLMVLGKLTRKEKWHFKEQDVG